MTDQTSLGAICAALLEDERSMLLLADAFGSAHQAAIDAEHSGAPQASWVEILTAGVSNLKNSSACLDAALVERIARTCYEANRIYSQSLDDFSQPGWMGTSSNTKESVRNAVRNLLLNPGAQPKESHANFLAHKLKTGWRYGPVKDEAAKTHPCIVAYHALPKAQRRKDDIFYAIVRGMQP